MIGPLARWVIKKAVSATEEAIRTNIAENKKAHREAEVRKEEEREAADPAYRAHKEALREQARIIAEKERIARNIADRKQARREFVKKFLWRTSIAMYAVCVLYRIGSPTSRGHNDFVVNILASVWMFIVLMFAISDWMAFGDEASGEGLGCGVVMLIPLCWLGYVFLDYI